MLSHLITIWFFSINVKKYIHLEEIEIDGGIILNGFLNSGGRK